MYMECMYMEGELIEIEMRNWNEEIKYLVGLKM